MTRILPVLHITIFLFFFVRTAKAQGNQTVANGAATAAATFPVTGCVYNWVNNTPGIGLAASGTGDIASFTAINNTNAPITATITATPATNGFAYIPNQGSNNVSVINVATGTVVATIPVGSTPWGVSVSPDGSRAYITNAGDGTISVINTATNTVVSTIPVSPGSFPIGIAVSPDGTHLYVVCNRMASVAVINTSTYSVIATILVGPNPFGVSVNPDGSRIYVTSAGSFNVTAINTTTNTIAATIMTASGSQGVSVSPDGSKVYVSEGNAHTVTVINTATNSVSSVISSIPTASNPLGNVLSPDGTRLYIVDGSAGKVYVVNTANNSLVATVSEGNTNASATGISITPDGSLVYVANAYSNTVSVISTATNIIVGTINVGAYPNTIGNFIIAGVSCTPVTFTIKVNPPPPTILITGALSAMSTTYGAASASQTFNVSGTNMTAGILVTPPAGFEVSTDNTTFGNTVTVGAAGTIAGTPVYIRLAATTAVGNYPGNIALSSAGAANVNVATVNSTVTPASLVITITPGIVSKIYGTTLADITGSTAFTTTGLQNSETIGSITTVYGTGSAATAAVGTYTGSVTGSVPVGGTFTTGNYNITYLPGNIIVTPAALTITANNANKTYGAVLIGGPGSTAFTTTGLENSETIGNVSVAYGPGSSAASARGTYIGSVSVSAPAGGTFTAGNYAINYVQGNIFVNPAVLTIIANDVTKTYGNTVTGGTGATAFTTTGLQNSETIGSITITYGTGPAATAASGSYAGQVTGSAATGGTFTPGNYAITYVPGNIIVTPAALTITASDVSKTYGTPLTGSPGSTAFTTTGLKNSETIGSVSAAYSTGSAATDAVGTYTGAVTGSSATGGTFTAGNYSITYAPGNIIVTPAALTITAGDAAKTYGTALTPGPGSTAFTTTGLQNSETIGSINIAYGTGSAATAAVATYAGSTTGSAATGGTFTGADYVITYVPGNIIVTPAALAITAGDVNKTYGAALTGGPGSTAFTTTGLQNSETIGGITIAYGTGPAATAVVSTYMGAVTGSAATGGTFIGSNYAITYVRGNIVVTPAALTITADDVVKLFGATLTGGPGSTAFTTTGLQNSETIGSVTIAYGTGSAATAAVGAYPGSVTASAPVGGTFSPGNYAVSYTAGNIIVIPVVTASAATGAISACAGMASANPNIQQFTVSGSGLTANISAAAPAGFEVSLTAGSGYGSVVSIVQSGGIVNSIVYVRSAASDPAGNISGNVLLSSTAAINQDVAVNGTVNPLPVVNAIANQAVVNGTATTATSFTGTANTYNWTNDTPGIGLAASGTGNIVPFTAVNRGTSTVVATIKITPVNFTGCTGTPNTFTITVNPTPAITAGTATGSITACAGSASASPNIKQVTVSGSYLLGNITATAPPGGGFEVSLAPGSGYGGSVTLTPSAGTIGNALIYIRSASSATGSISGNVTLVSPGAASQTIAVTGIINPLPAVNAIANQAVVNSTATTAASFTGTANTYNWTNNTPGIGLAASGTGNIAPFNAVNIGTSPVTATITVTPVNTTGCAGAPTAFTITVNPSPAITAGTVAGSISLCAGSASASPNIQQVKVSGSYLLGDITATAPAGFEVSIAAGSGYGSSVTLTQSGGGIANAVIYVRSAASAPPGNLSGNILLASSGAVSQGAGASATIYALPAVDFILPAVCLADAYAQFTDASTIADNTQSAFTYLWNFGDANSTPANNTSTLQSPQHKYSREGNYTATLTVTSKNGCSVTKSKPFTVNGSIPLAGFSVENKNLLCSSDSVTFDDQSSVDFGNITRIVWFFDYNNHPADSVEYTAATMRTDKKYRHSYGVFNSPLQQNYLVTMISYSGQICKNVIQQTITINANPIVSLSPAGPVILCQSDAAVQIAENRNGFSGTGAFSGTGVSSTGLFDPKVSGAGTFTINYLFTSATTGCTYAASIPVTVNPSPVVTIAAPEVTFLEGGLLTITANAAISGGTMTYKWTPSTGLSQDDILNPVANPTENTTYTFTATSDKFCSTSAKVVVTVLKGPVVPNTFTPNGDGINDTWDIKNLNEYPNCTVQIVNRYGAQVYYSHNYPIPWDGKYKGADLPSGVYYYIINPGSGGKVIAGPVTIIR